MTNNKSTLAGKMTQYRWIICAMLFFATTVNYLDRQVLSLTWDEFIKPEFHWNEYHYGLITSIFSIVYAVCMLFAGRFIDWMGTKKGYLWAIGVWSMGACMHALCGIATEAWVLWAASLVMGACSVVPQLFMPMAGQYSRPADKARNIGCVLSGLLCGILASRVVSGMVGQWLGWRTMFAVASVAMVALIAVTLAIMPGMKPKFSGWWAQLMASVGRMVAGSGRIRVCSVRAALGFGSMLSVWSCMAFRLAAEPFCAGADAVGALGLCGVAGAMVAGGMGRLVGRFGVRRFSVAGAVVLMVAWAVAWGFDGTYAGLVVAIILIDIGLQCLQLSNQSACMIEVPDAANRANTIFMTTYFVGGAMGTMLSALGWNMAGWDGVCAVGALLAAASLVVTLCSRY